MRINVRGALLTAALLLACPAAAQKPSQEAEPSQEIVVTGQREREEQVRDFVKALTPAPSGAITRFVDEVCPVTVGLTPEQNGKVDARLRQVAAAIGLRVGKSGCAANTLVIVTQDKAALIEKLAQERPETFGTLSSGQVRKLARLPGPAAAWRLGGAVDENGDRLDNSLVNRTTESQGRLKSQIRRGFDASAVVVERASLEGLTETQLADYAAMRLFAELDPARLPKPAPATILSILTAPRGTAVPITMTQWDLGLLRGLYSASPNIDQGSQRSAIAREVREELRKPRS
jgi:hypothetical protein